MSDSDLDVLERRLTESVDDDTTARPAASVLGFVGVSAGFAVLLGLCAIAAITLWLALFGSGLLPEISVIVAWVTNGGVAVVGS